MAATTRPRKSKAEGPAAPAKRAPARREAKARPVLAPLRAPAHRAFIGRDFGLVEEFLDEAAEPQGLTYIEIMADPRLAALGRQVFDELRRQFASDPRGEGDEEEAYRLRLESWADALEILLEEVLDELATLGSGRGARADDLALG